MSVPTYILLPETGDMTGRRALATVPGFVLATVADEEATYPVLRCFETTPAPLVELLANKPVELPSHPVIVFHRQRYRQDWYWTPRDRRRHARAGTRRRMGARRSPEVLCTRAQVFVVQGTHEAVVFSAIEGWLASPEGWRKPPGALSR